IVGVLGDDAVGQVALRQASAQVVGVSGDPAHRVGYACQPVQRIVEIPYASARAADGDDIVRAIIRISNGLPVRLSYRNQSIRAVIAVSGGARRGGRGL